MEILQNLKTVPDFIDGSIKDTKFYVKLIVSLIRQVPLEFKLNMMF